MLDRAQQFSVSKRGAPHAHPLPAPTHRRAAAVLALALLASAGFATSAQAATVGLGTATSFSVLGGTTVTNTGPTVMSGDLGVSPGTAITGFPPGTVLGTVHANDGVAQRAQGDLTTAYNSAAGAPSNRTISADLAGLTLAPGVYTSASSLGLSGELTLDAHGDSTAVFIFQAGSTLTTGSGSHVLLRGGAQACNVYWQVGSSATIGTATDFRGNILALTSIALTTGATLQGRALARNGAVTLDDNTITSAACSTGGPTTTGTTGGGTTGSGTGTTGTGTTGTTGNRTTTTPGHRGSSRHLPRVRRPRHGQSTPRTPKRRVPHSPARPPLTPRQGFTG